MSPGHPGINSPGESAVGGNELRILVLAPYSNDGRLSADFLRKAGLSALACRDCAEMCSLIATGCGGLLLAEEALGQGAAQQLATVLQNQPSWSDMPMVVITGNGDAAVRDIILASLGTVGNVSLIERPFRPATLVSSFIAALASRRRQYQVRTLLAERENMVATLHEADHRKDEFLAMLAHELRNPLASIANATKLLKTASDMESHTWATSVIDRQVRQLAHLIDDLLDVSRITQGKIRLRMAVLDAATILDRACESVRPLMAKRHHRLTCDYSQGSLWLEADATRLEQIINNLLTNAAKYTPDGGHIILSAILEGTDIIIRVKDNGMGIPPQRLPEMFQLFTQGERSIARSEGGLGIGLTIVQKLTELHAGSIHAHSDGPDLGSTFTIRLPAASAPSTREATAPVTLVTAAFAPRRILIVDDNVDSAHGLGRLLGRAGHHITLAHDGAEALAQMQTRSPESIILDIGLPGMDGYEVARRIRNDEQGSHVQLIALTGYGQEEDRQHALRAGFDHHLIKPVDVPELKKLLSLPLRTAAA